MSSAFILPQTKLCTWSKALVMVFTLASITVLPWSQRGEYGFGTPKPSCHWQLLATGNSDRQGGGPLHLASPPVLHVSRFNVILKCHQPGKSHPWPVTPCWPQCQRRDCRRRLFSTVHEGRWDYCGHNKAGAGFFYGKNNINLMCKMHTALCQSIQRIAGSWVWNGVVPFMSPSWCITS